jgi:drug/metabolite transporter (DMT)-like permease
VGAIALSVVAAVVWGIADFGAGLKARQIPVVVVVAGMLLVGAVAALVALAVADPAPIARPTLLLGLAAGVMTAIGLTALYRALAIGPMSVVAPISAAGVMVPIVAGLAGGDRPSGAQAIGIVLAITGMLVVVARAEDVEAASAGRGSRTTAVTLAVIGAIGLGVYYLAAHDVRDGQEHWFLLVGQLSAGVLLALGALARGLGMPSRADRWYVVGLGALSFAAWVTSTVAVGAGDLSLTATIISLYPIVTTLLAVALTTESLSGAQVGALIAAFTGVALIASG